MATFTPTQIGMAAWNAGFRDEPTLARAVAVALAENQSGNTAALGDTTITDKTWGPSVGLWQIRSLKAETGKGTSRDIKKLTDPQFNANAAWEISNHGKNWIPWSTFKDNSYMKHISTGKAVAADLHKRATAASPNPLNWIFPGLGNVSDAVGGIGNAIGGVSGIPGAIQNAANAALQTFQKISLSVAAVIVAVVLIVLAVVIMMRKPLEDGLKTAAKVAP